MSTRLYQQLFSKPTLDEPTRYAVSSHELNGREAFLKGWRRQPPTFDPESTFAWTRGYVREETDLLEAIR